MDALGSRLKAAVMVPSTNTIVEPDYYSMAPNGCTFHVGRILIRNQSLSNDAEFENLLIQIRGAIDEAIDNVMTCEPDCMIMGMSAETFWGGKEGNLKFQTGIEEKTGLRVYTGADARNKALQLYNAKRIAVVTPYQEVGDAQVVAFFRDYGYEVVKIIGLKCETAVAIAHVSEERLRDTLIELNEEDVDAIVQVGTNLSMAKLAGEAEKWLKKPVIAINTATLWHALREQGIHDKVYGFGSLLSEH
ncbi:Maleate isomerase [Ureibacillus acetophenoni]